MNTSAYTTISQESNGEPTPLEFNFEHVEARYRKVQIVLATLVYALLAVAALFLLLLDGPGWCIVTEAIVVSAWLINVFILRKAWIAKGYALRPGDISYRGGILFPKVTTIPVDRIQQVSVRQNPVSKALGLYSVEVVNGAQYLSSLTIPGLTLETANRIKGTLIEKLKQEVPS